MNSEDKEQLLKALHEMNKNSSIVSVTHSPKNMTKINATVDNDDSSELFDEINRIKRQIELKSFSDSLNEDDENENLGIEEGFIQDGEADHHEIIDEHTDNDRSNSEFWSSFSSSEERLLQCEGLILSLPLRSNRKCKNPANFEENSFSNTITYT